MNDANAKFPDLISRIKTEFRQDKKRTTLLVVLLVVASIVTGRFIVSSSPPKKAAADNAARLPAGGGQVSNIDGQSTKQYVGADPKRRRIDTTLMDRDIIRDIFWPDTRCFPSSEQADADSDAEQQKAVDKAQKLAEAEQRERFKRAEHIKSIRTKAKALRLTTTMLGRSPTALINGQVLRAGDLVNGFRIKSISSDCCVVVMEGVEVELQMVE